MSADLDPTCGSHHHNEIKLQKICPTTTTTIGYYFIQAHLISGRANPSLTGSSCTLFDTSMATGLYQIGIKFDSDLTSPNG